METGTKTWRRATAEDAVALRDLERVASRTGLAHVFGELPYPDDDVLARWALLLDDPEVTVEVVEDERGMVVLAAHDDPPRAVEMCGSSARGAVRCGRRRRRWRRECRPAASPTA